MSAKLETKVYPSLPAQSRAELLALGEAVQDVTDYFQVDLVDGIFAPAFSWPFAADATEEMVTEALRTLEEFTAGFAIGMDCMVHEPARLFPLFHELGVSRVVIHFGSAADMKGTIDAARTAVGAVGLAVTPGIPYAAFAPLIDSVDFIQVMGIAEVGKQGQLFDERSLAVISTVRTAHPELSICVDGSVNVDTIIRLHEAGANWFAPGSAVAKADDPHSALLALRALVEKTNEQVTPITF